MCAGRLQQLQGVKTGHRKNEVVNEGLQPTAMVRVLWGGGLLINITAVALTHQTKAQAFLLRGFRDVIEGSRSSVWVLHFRNLVVSVKSVFVACSGRGDRWHRRLAM